MELLDCYIIIQRFFLLSGPLELALEKEKKLQIPTFTERKSKKWQWIIMQQPNSFIVVSAPTTHVIEMHTDDHIRFGKVGAAKKSFRNLGRASALGLITGFQYRF